MSTKTIAIAVQIEGDAQLRQLQANFDQVSNARKALNKSERDGLITSKQASKQRADLNVQLKANRNALTDHQNALLKNNNALKKNSGFVAGVRKGMGQWATSMIGITAAIVGVTKLVGSAVNIFVDFEKANSKLEAVLGATETQMASLKTQAKKLGSTTAFTASQVVDLQTEFAKLGFPTDDILNMTKATLNGAAALGSELGEQAALTGALLKQFGLDSEEAGRVNDVLAESAAKSALDFSKLSTALPIVGATANTAGVSIERTTALLGTLSDRGIDASTSGTSLRNIFLQLSKKGLTFDEAMQKINDSTDKNATSMQLFGTRGSTAGVILAETGGSVDKLTESLENSDGAAKKMADTMLDNLSGDITKAGSAWEGFVLSLEDGNGMLGKLARGFVNTGTSILSALTPTNQLSDSLKTQQDELIGVTLKLNDVNTNTSTRLDIIKDLNNNYPELLKNLGVEAVNLENVDEAVKSLNGNFGKRVTIAKAVEEVTNQQSLTSEFQASTQKLLNDAIFEGTKALNEKGLVDLLNNKTQEEQIKIIEENVSWLSSASNAVKSYNNSVWDTNSLQESSNDIFEESSQIISSVVKNKEDLNTLTTEELRQLAKSGLLKEKALDLAARELIISRELSSAKKAESPALDDNTEAIEVTEKEKNARKKAADERAKMKADEIKMLRDLEIQVMEEGLGKELAAENAKFDDKIQNAIEKYGSETEVLARLEEQRIQRLNEVRLEFEAERIAKEEEEKEIKREKQNAEDEAFFQKEKERLDKEYAQEQENAKKLAELETIKRESRLATLNAAAGVFDSFSTLAKEGSNEQKALATAGALINTYAGAAAALAPPPIGAGPIVGPLIAASTIANGISTVAKINGIKFEDGGVLNGPSHANGGIPFSVGGQLGFEAEGGEAIINKRSTEMFAPLLSAINEAGGGVAFERGGRLTKFQGGGALPSNVGVTASQQGFASGSLDLEEFSSAIVDGINDKTVVNVATSTTDTATEVLNIASEASF